MAKRRADGQRIPLSGKLLRHKVAFRAVFQCKLYPKLLCDADCGEQVVRLMRMRLERHFAFKHGQKRLKFYVERNILSRILLLFVIPRTQEHFAYFCGGGHAGRDALFPVTPLWIFPKSAFHRRAVAHDHIVYPGADGLERNKGAADHVRRARPVHTVVTPARAACRKVGSVGSMPSIARSCGTSVSFISL